MAVERARLTVEVVKATKPRGSARVVWDTEIPRFGLRVRRAGSKVYVLRLRVDGRQRWYTIGPHGDPWTPDTAREEAERIIGQAANVTKLRQTGAAPANLFHPIEARERTKTVPTLADFAKRYLAEYAVPHKGTATVEADRGLLGLRERFTGEDGAKARTILEALGEKRIDRIARADVVQLHLAWQDTPTRANRALALLSHMFTMTEEWGIRPAGTNPCRRVHRFPETKRERFLSVQELSRLGAALKAAEKAEKLTPYGLAAVRLLVFTGARASEILGLTWDQVNTDAGMIRLPQSKTGPKTLMLNAPAAAVLAGLRRIKGNKHVIVGGLKGAALTLSGLEQIWQEVRRAAGLEDVRLHDLRHSFASVAVAGGASLPIIGALLGHTQAQTTKRYAHLADAPLQAASGAVASAIEAAMRGKQPRRPNVARMRRGLR